MRSTRNSVFGAIVVATVATIAACSKGLSNTAAGESANSRSSAGQVSKGNVCDQHLLTQSDVSGILGAPITETQTIPGDAQSCEFKTASYSSATVTLRPGLGNVTVQTWLDGKVPVSATPLQGVGDKAAWQPTLQEVIATKNNVLCDIQVMGGLGNASTNPAQMRIGSLCNKIFAAGS